MCIVRPSYRGGEGDDDVSLDRVERCSLAERTAAALLDPGRALWNGQLLPTCRSVSTWPWSAHGRADLRAVRSALVDVRLGTYAANENEAWAIRTSLVVRA